MRVALLALHFTEYSVALAAALARTGHEVLLVLERGNLDAELDGTVPEHPRLTVEILHHRGDPRAMAANAWRLRRLVREFRPDVLHAQEVIYDWIHVVAQTAGVPVVLTVHDPRPHSGEEKGSLVQRRYDVYRSLLRRRAAQLITHGDELVAHLCEDLGRDATTVHAVPHGALGVMPQDPPPTPFQPTGKLLFLGRMHRYKGLHVFVEALQSLTDQGIPRTAVVAGRGPALEENAEALQALGAQVEDRYLSREEMLALVDEAHAVVLPYTDGTQSGVALLAVGRGRPCVASNVGSIPDAVRDGVNGLLVPPSSPVALTEGLARIIEDDALARSLANGASDLAHGEFGWDAIAQATTGVYQAACESALGARPDGVHRRRLAPSRLSRR